MSALKISMIAMPMQNVQTVPAAGFVLVTLGTTVMVSVALITMNAFVRTILGGYAIIVM